MKPIFRNSVYGFRREDVATFISKQSNRYEKKISELEEENLQIKRRYDKMLSDMKSDRRELERLRAVRREQCKLMEAALQDGKAFSARRDSLFVCIDENENSILKLEKQNSQLKAMVESLEQYREKAAKFDRLAEVLSDVVNQKETHSTAELSANEVSPIPPTEEILCNLCAVRNAVNSLLADYEKILGVIEELFCKESQ